MKVLETFNMFLVIKMCSTNGLDIKNKENCRSFNSRFGLLDFLQLLIKTKAAVSCHVFMCPTDQSMLLYGLYVQSFELDIDVKHKN